MDNKDLINTYKEIEELKAKDPSLRILIDWVSRAVELACLTAFAFNFLRPMVFPIYVFSFSYSAIVLEVSTNAVKGIKQDWLYYMVLFMIYAAVSCVIISICRVRWLYFVVIGIMILAEIGKHIMKGEA